MRTAVLSLAALAAVAAGAGTADAQLIRRGVVYGPAYPGYYYAPQYVVPAAPVVAPVATTTVVPAAGTTTVPAAASGVVFPTAPGVVGYSYYPSYYYTYPGLRRR
jgi:hypothetical protein